MNPDFSEILDAMLADAHSPHHERYRLVIGEPYIVGTWPPQSKTPFEALASKVIDAVPIQERRTQRVAYIVLRR